MKLCSEREFTQNLANGKIKKGRGDTQEVFLKRAENDLNENKAELIAFGRPFLANPVLVERLKNYIPLNNEDHNTFYTPGEKGYTDYPPYVNINVS